MRRKILLPGAIILGFSLILGGAILRTTAAQDRPPDREGPRRDRADSDRDGPAEGRRGVRPPADRDGEDRRGPEDALRAREEVEVAEARLEAARARLEVAEFRRELAARRGDLIEGQGDRAREEEREVLEKARQQALERLEEARGRGREGSDPAVRQAAEQLERIEEQIRQRDRGREGRPSPDELAPIQAGLGRAEAEAEFAQARLGVIEAEVGLSRARRRLGPAEGERGHHDEAAQGPAPDPDVQAPVHPTAFRIIRRPRLALVDPAFRVPGDDRTDDDVEEAEAPETDGDRRTITIEVEVDLGGLGPELDRFLDLVEGLAEGTGHHEADGDGGEVLGLVDLLVHEALEYAGEEVDDERAEAILDEVGPLVDKILKMIEAIAEDGADDTRESESGPDEPEGPGDSDESAG